MFTAAAFFWVVPGLFFLFALAFALVGWHPLGTKGARWAAAGFLVGGLGSIFDTQRNHLPYVDTLASPAHWLAVYCLLKSILVRRKADFYRPLLAVWAVFAIVAHGYFVLVMPSIPARIMLLNILIPSLMTLALPGMMRGKKSAIDKMLASLIIASAITYPVRLAIFIAQRQISEVENISSWSQYIILFYLVIAAIGVLTALAIMLATGVDMIAEQVKESHIDPLTGIGNRRAIDKWIDGELDTEKYGAVLMIDLDHFKRINDQFGHAAGDEVLRRVAKELQAKLHSFAKVARVGGEEFVALIHLEHQAVAGQLALMVREAIAAIEFSGPLDRYKLTASVGLALRTPGIDMHDLIKRADMATYQAKANGRNRAMRADDRDGLTVLSKVA
jgi:diguanylate cyclase (GGDEF)-like protein